MPDGNALIHRPLTLVIVRHGESERNKAKKGATYFADDFARQCVRGIPDHQIALTDRGHAQAVAAGNWLRDRFGTFDYAYHSGYRRTAETLTDMLSVWPEASRTNIAVRENLFIRERDPGFAYDMTEAEAEAAFPYLREHWQTFGGFFSRPPGGESIADVTQRVYEFINMLFRDRGGQRILIATHGGTIRAFRFLLERWSVQDPRATKWPKGTSPKNCGITIYKFDRELGRLVLKEYNTVAPILA